MYILGVTGNIGSGKSTVSKHLAESGAGFSQSDDLAKELLQNDSDLLEQLAHRFGQDILDERGQLRRHILAERAFATREDQKFLNQLIHPKVRQVTLARLDQARKENRSFFVIDAPLLFEAGVDSICDSVLVVVADNIYRQSRVEHRSQITESDFKRRDNLQLSIEEKINRADHVIYNNGSLNELLAQVDVLYDQLNL
ncbi:MAG: dephospho-CoA kinase [Candidatus Marinimicrobia bacterium]|nr:dephospho-CoA kinase [Candidatus Neomarinimicrobiota bacterium]